MKVETKFNPGDMVVLKHDKEKLQRMVTGFSVRGTNNLSYCLSMGDEENWHVECEIEKSEAGPEKTKPGFRK